MDIKNVKEFKTWVLDAFYKDIHHLEENNYDYARFSYDGVDRSKEFHIGIHCTYMDWFISNAENIFTAFSRLADDKSKSLYLDLIRFRLAGHLHMRINSNVPNLASEAKKFKEIFREEKSNIVSSGIFGELVFYDAEWNGVRYTLDSIRDALALIPTLVYRQYFFERNGVVIKPEPGDYIIDGGACTGDTAVVFSKSVGPSGAIYAFDLVQNHIDICKYNFSRPGFENIKLFEYGLADKTVEAPPIQLSHYAPGFRVGEQPLPLCRIDDLVVAGKITKIDFIKLDIEGSEMDAIKGALSSIARFKPKLAISIYHKPDDLFEICNFLHEQGLGYKFYIDHYTIHAEETVLYCR